MLIDRLNLEKVGDILKRVPLASMQANHKKASSTVKYDMLPGESDLELQFIKDVFEKNTDEVIDKWYNGKENAADLLFGRRKEDE